MTRNAGGGGDGGPEVSRRLAYRSFDILIQIYWMSLIASQLVN